MISKADKVIFPGVGEAGSAMKYLRELNLDLAIKSLTQPFLGICLGLQLMCLYSEEGDTTGLGIYDTEAVSYTHLDVYKRQISARTIRRQLWIYYHNRKHLKTIKPPSFRKRKN